MFATARLKLTAWYLVIIMAISLLFSMVIYNNINSELRRFEKLTVIIKPEEDTLELPFRRMHLPPARINPDMIRAARTRLVTALTLVNIAILGLSATAGYFLAGKTLKPIKDMVDEQNQFISDASHELRTPLTALKAGLEVNLRDKRLTLKAAKAAITESITEVNALQSLSDSLLTLAQYQKPNNHTETGTILLDKLVKDAVRKVQSLATEKRITITESVPNITVLGNPYSLTELLVIILDNAIKYSKTGDTVEINAKKRDGSVSISVTDHGMGIPKKDLPHIFDRFYRADVARTKSSQNGYGLGLAIAKKIVDLHHGTLTVQSTVGNGSTFTVMIPTHKTPRTNRSA